MCKWPQLEETMSQIYYIVLFESIHFAIWKNFSVLLAHYFIELLRVNKKCLPLISLQNDDGNVPVIMQLQNRAI